MDDNMDSMPPSPGRMAPSPNTSMFHEYSSPKPGFSQWNFSDGNYYGNDSSSTLSLVSSPSCFLSWPCEKTFHPEREGEMERDFNQMLRPPSPEASCSYIFSPSHCSNNFFSNDPELRQYLHVRQQLLSEMMLGLGLELDWREMEVQYLHVRQQLLSEMITVRQHLLSEMMLGLELDWKEKMEGIISQLTVAFIHTEDEDYVAVDLQRTDNPEQVARLVSILVTMKQLLSEMMLGLELDWREKMEGIISQLTIAFIHTEDEDYIAIDLQRTNNLVHILLTMKQQNSLKCSNIKNSTRKTSKRKCRNIKKSTGKPSTRKCKNNKKSIPLEDLQQFSGNLLDAAKSFGVSVSTLKRCCRQLGITDWRHRKTIKNNQYLSEPKDIVESVHGGAEMGDQMAGGCKSCEREFIHEQIAFSPEFEKGTQMENTFARDLFVYSTHERCKEAGHPLELPIQPSELNPFLACSTVDAVSFTAEGEFLMVHNICATEAFNSEQVPESNWTSLSFSDPAPKQGKANVVVKTPLVTKMQHRKTVTMKAEYGKDMIRFQLSLTSGINELRKEVAKKLTLEVGTFSIKYLDDDNDWILITCDEDLKVCFNISIFLDRKVIRLLIHDIRPISGDPDKAMGKRREIEL